MNSKLMKAGIAGAAVVALAAGGGTYAAYSDFANVTGNHAGAGTLTLDVGPNAGQDLKFDHVTMAPGGINAERQVFVTSNDAASTPSANLFVSLTNLQGTEDGCDGNAEVLVDAACTTGPVTSPTAGQFIRDATVQWYSYVPDSPGVCNQSYSPSMKTVTPQHGGSLSALASQTATTPYELDGTSQNYKLPYLAPGQGLCFAMEVSLAYGVSNASQGDSASFDLHFDLVQAPYGTPTTPAPSA